MRTLNLLHWDGMKKQSADEHLFIYDPNWIEAKNLSKNSVVFLLTLCLEQNVPILIGETQTTLIRFCLEKDIERILIQSTYDATLFSILKNLPIKVDVIEDPLMFLDETLYDQYFKSYQKLKPKLLKRVKND